MPETVRRARRIPTMLLVTVAMMVVVLVAGLSATGGNSNLITVLAWLGLVGTVFMDGIILCNNSKKSWGIPLLCLAVLMFFVGTPLLPALFT